MHTLALDPWMGASGDMLLGVLLDVGADESRLRPIEEAIGVSYEVTTTRQAGLAAADVSVSTAGTPAHRTPGEVVEAVDGIGLSDRVTSLATEVVDCLATAEASVHGVDPAEVHFHEVGADDAIADICGVVALLDDLGVERIVTAPVATGAGTVEMAHGTYPVPPPAVTAIAETASWSIVPGPVDGELLTPTGAALLAILADGVSTLPTMSIETTGYGAGDRRYPDRPNVLRGLLGTTRGGLTREPITVLETIVDDATPETIGALHETLTETGALDVAAIPATMKQSRPGHLLQVVVREANAAAVARRLAAETGTLGVRELPVAHRFVANRRIETVNVTIDSQVFAADVKVATDDEGVVLDVSTEDADARRIAQETDVPVREVRRLAETAFYRDS